MTPTARTLKYLRDSGYLAGVVEQWVPGAHIRRDLFGCMDVLTFHPCENEVLAIQCTTSAHVSDRLKKAQGLADLAEWLRMPCRRFEVWGWFKSAGRWQVKRIPLPYEEMAGRVLERKPTRKRRSEPSLFPV